jgi:lipoyl-dependent peroxiredoxin subunit D
MYEFQDYVEFCRSQGRSDCPEIYQGTTNNMTQWVDKLKEAIPDYAKDTRLNLDAVIKRSALDQTQAECCALAAAFATGNTKLWTWIQSEISEQTDAVAAVTAASLMSMNNIWYPFVETCNDPQLEGLPAQLRMNAIATHGGVDQPRFEAYSLAASIVGKCEFCIKAHYQALKKAGYSVTQLRDIGRISAVMVSVSKIMSA